MKRYAINELYNWKEQKNRKPLILHGARQVGKTWLMIQFAKEAFAKYIYINFESNDRLRQLFQKDFDMQRIVFEIFVATGIQMDKDTLLILDEIQEAPRGITALKYFYEQMPEQPVMAAGSLLGISMHGGESFPVGKVDFCRLHPLSFFEFLEAIGKVQYVELLQRKQWDTVNVFADALADMLRQYYYVGGMPEVVQDFVDNQDLQRVRQLQQNILEAYDHDFSKHAPLSEVPRLRMVWHSVSGQLAKENKKFIYGFLKEGARAKSFELAIEWLCDAGLVGKVNRTRKGALPLATYEDFSAFKIYMLDVGLLGAMAGLSSQTLLDGNSIFTEFKGALTEQFVFQQIQLTHNNKTYYWSAENSRGELDFVVQVDNKIIPIEVKAEENLQSKSLKAFVESNPGLHGVRFSMAPYREQEWMTNYPLYSINSIL